MKSLALGALLLLAACSDSDQQTNRAPALAENGVDCAVEGATAFERVCTLEEASGEGGTTLTLRHPSGGFRRLLVVTDGLGVVAADGSDPAIVSAIAGDRIEVALAGDRYRLPATVKGQ